MEKLTVNDPETHSADILADNIEQLKTLFPEAVTEGKLDFEVLKMLLGGVVDEREEKYGLNWHGKRRARQMALALSTGTLRPYPEESTDWDSTQNLMIEGDNLEVLKLLQKSYAGKVKLIYIDPPYNTGNDFVYPDDFQDNLKNYQKLVGWRDEVGSKVSSLAGMKNSEASGRFHTDWLNMMLPRIKLARNLLREDGVIFISIDDHEIANLEALCYEVFGTENFIACIVWQKKRGKDNSALYISTSHEYLLFFAKNINALHLNKLVMSDKRKTAYANPDNDPKGAYVLQPAWASGMKRGPTYDIVLGNIHFKKRMWLYAKDTLLKNYIDNRLSIKGNHKDGLPNVYLKVYLNESEGVLPDTIWVDAGNTGDAVGEIKSLFGGEILFDTPKPTTYIAKMLRVASDENCIVLDFFAGSGSTGHAVMAQNATDTGNRRYILVQLPEPLDPENSEQKTGADFCDKLGRPRNIAELTKERLRRTGRKIRSENPMFAGDLGFRVFKLDSSNIRAWDPNREDMEGTLMDNIEHIWPDRSEADILYELLLKLGLDLCVPIEIRTITGKEVHSIGAGVLIVCLAGKMTRGEVEPLAQGIIQWHQELAPVGDTTCVFRDSAFADDVAKTNLTAILNQHGLENVHSL